MTLPTKASKKRRSLPKLSLGLRGSLFVAFTAIAAIAILMSAGSGMVFNQLGGMMSNLSDREIPRLTNSLQLSAASESLSAQAPLLLASPDGKTLRERTDTMMETHQLAATRVTELERLGANKSVVTALDAMVRQSGDTIRSLGSSATEGLAAAAEHARLAKELKSAQENFTAVAAPALKRAQDQVNTILQSGAMSQGEAEAAGKQIELLGDIVSSTYRVSAGLMATLAATDMVEIVPLEEEFTGLLKEISSNLKLLAPSDQTKEVIEVTEGITKLGLGDKNVFRTRIKELDAKDFGAVILEETRKLSSGLNVSVRMLVDQVGVQTTEATTSALETSALATKIMVIAGVTTLIGSILFVWLYVGRNILRRISALQTAMTSLSNGNLDVEMAKSRQNDEVAAMAGSLEVFRNNMRQARSLSASQDNERAAKAERASRIEAQIASFEEKVSHALEKLQSSADAMQATAQSMSTTAEQSNALVSAVAAAAEETSVNVQTVSSGTEELTSSIAEISRQVEGSSRIAAKAVSEADKTDVTMQGLAENANKISVVIDLIQTIASQTNLLALNATIEAARAGDAGKGFAVVASEVKSLADQTAKATDEIRMQITSMQQVTASAVGAIRSIGSTISEINEVTSAISGAVEQQGAATREIARNIQEAAGGTTEVSSNIVGVSDASQRAGTAAHEVLDASDMLRQEADVLRAEIHSFLANIRAA